MRILSVNNYHSLKGGVEKVYFETARLLTENNHQVAFLSVRDTDVSPIGPVFFAEAESFDKLGGLVGKIKGTRNFFYNPSAIAAAEKAILEFKPDVIHLHIFYGRLSNSILGVFKKYNLPVVMSVHEYRMLCPVYVLQDQNGNVCEVCPKSKNYFSCITKKCNKGSLLFSSISAAECAFRDKFYNYAEYIDRFIMVSKFIFNKHAEYNQAIKNKSTQLYNFVSADVIKNLESNPNAYLNKTILYFGRLSNEKGLITLLKAWKLFKASGNDSGFVLKIAGTGSQENELKQFAMDENISDVVFLGFCNAPMLRKLFAETRYSIIGSEWYENNPMSVIESLAAGIPVIGSKIGGIPELISEGSTGFLFEPASPVDLEKTLDRALNLDTISYQKMQNESEKFAKNNFNELNHLEKLLDIYNSAILSKANSLN